MILILIILIWIAFYSQSISFTFLIIFLGARRKMVCFILPMTDFMNFVPLKVTARHILFIEFPDLFLTLEKNFREFIIEVNELHVLLLSKKTWIISSSTLDVSYIYLYFSSFLTSATQKPLCSLSTKILPQNVQGYFCTAHL